MNKSVDFAHGSVEKAILLQAGPLLIAQLIQLLYNVVDRIYIGHIAGSDGLALTGVGVCFPLIMLITAFTDWFAMGGTPIFSILRGEGKDEEAHRVMGVSTWLLIVGSSVIMLVFLLFHRPMLYALGASEATYPYARSYFMIYMLGNFFFMTGAGLNYYISAQGYPQMGMITIAVGAAMNFVLDPLFIYAFHMGVAGAAIATVISQLATFVFVVRFLVSDKPIFPLKKEIIHFDAGLGRQILSLGFANFIMKATNTLTQAACNIQLQRFGGDLYIGIFAIINSIRDIISLPATAVTHSSQPVLGFNYGAKKYSRLRRGILFEVGVAGGYSAAAWILVMLFPTAFISIFTSDADTLMYGKSAVQIYFAAFIFMIGQFGGQSVFSALEQTKRAIFFSMLRKVIIVLPLTLLLPSFMGVNGVFAAEPVSNVIGGLATFITMLVTVYFRLPKKDDVEAHLG